MLVVLAQEHQWLRVSERSASKIHNIYNKDFDTYTLFSLLTHLSSTTRVIVSAICVVPSGSRSLTYHIYIMKIKYTSAVRSKILSKPIFASCV